MYKIYFKNDKDEYHFPILKERLEEIFLLANIYWKFLPNIMITDDNDFNIFEVKNGDILHLSDKDINSIEDSFNNNPINIPYTDFQSLLKLYKKKQEELKNLKTIKIAEEIRELDIHLLALAAKKSINLRSYNYINSENFIDLIDIQESNNNDLYKYFENLHTDIKENKTLVIMPVTRIVFDGRPIVGKYNFIPPQSIDYKQLFTIEDSLFNNELRTIVSKLTLFSLDVLYNNYCIVFSYDLNWNEFKSYKHNNDDITLLKLLSSHTDELFNLIKFYCCKLNLPDTLPGEVGAWNNSNDYLGALLFNKQEGSFLIAGSAIESSRVVKGIGLDINGIDFIEEQLSYSQNNCDISIIIKYSLSLFNDALYSNNSTTKFMKIMTLFEYMSYPDEYSVFKKVKQYIICHSAESKTEYQSLSDRFKILSQNYRTEIVHNGKTLEMIISNLDERKELFNELELYVKKVIISMMGFREQTWEDFINYRKSLIASFS